MDDSTHAKACTQCLIVKPLTEFHKRAASADGLAFRCKPCALEIRRAYRREHAERVRAYAAAWRAKNPTYSADAAKAWRTANPGRKLEYGRQYELANADQVAARKRRWYEANREAIAQRNATPERVEARRQSVRASMERTREERAERQRQRRVDKLGLTVEKVDLDALWTGVCGICNQSMDPALRWPDPLSKSIDHILPLSRGGTHEAANLQWAHLRCNVSKGPRPI